MWTPVISDGQLHQISDINSFPDHLFTKPDLAQKVPITSAILIMFDSALCSLRVNIRLNVRILAGTVSKFIYFC